MKGHISKYSYWKADARTHEGGCWAAVPPPPIKILKIASFVDTILAKVLRDLPFSQNKSLKLAYYQKTGILKIKLKIWSVLDELKKQEC